ncbi:xyloside xylosyltransferase 1 isoform X4 [Cyanistes caeruleus]|uniref:xyloside xylosyltransferase 1 isoform X4 n=1 Tax=Cyanistes caeruleus TaxID=156563 RepID=UPI000CDA73F1|nr:xyloside xylosyltransferase 1 isoform X4 [Cyanistes caeruleus]
MPSFPSLSPPTAHTLFSRQFRSYYLGLPFALSHFKHIPCPHQDTAYFTLGLPYHICLFDQLSGALQVPGTTRWAAQPGIVWWDHSQVRVLLPPQGVLAAHRAGSKVHLPHCSLHRSSSVCQLGMCLQLGITPAAIHVLAQELNNIFGGTLSGSIAMRTPKPKLGSPLLMGYQASTVVSCS